MRNVAMRHAETIQGGAVVVAPEHAPGERPADDWEGIPVADEAPPAPAEDPRAALLTGPVETRVAASASGHEAIARLRELEAQSRDLAAQIRRAEEEHRDRKARLDDLQAAAAAKAERRAALEAAGRACSPELASAIAREAEALSQDGAGDLAEAVGSVNRGFAELAELRRRRAALEPATHQARSAATRVVRDAAAAAEKEVRLELVARQEALRRAIAAKCAAENAEIARIDRALAMPPIPVHEGVHDERVRKLGEQEARNARADELLRRLVSE